MKEKYLRRWPTLAIGFLLLLLCAVMVLFVEPSVIQNLPPQHTYLAFYVVLFLGLSLVFSFAFLNSHRGLLLATFLVTVLWLCQVRLFSVLTVAVLAVTLLLIELLLTLRA